MQNREFDTGTETKPRLSRQVVKRQRDEHETRDDSLPQRDSFVPVISGIGDASSAGVHASMLNMATKGRPFRAGRSLLRLQRQYGNRYVQRVLALTGKSTGEAEAAPEVEESIQQARGGGHGIDSRVRGQMESAFGADFGNVRLHTDARAGTLNRKLNARAFTTGQDIFFRQGAHNPGSSNGRKLLAHELTHVVQQTGDEVRRKLTIGQPGDKYEQEADQVARAVMQQEQQPVQGESGEGLVCRQVEEEDEEKSVQMKTKYSRIQRQIEEEEERSVQDQIEYLFKSMWRNTIYHEVKHKCQDYRCGIVDGLLQASLPAKYDDGVKIFLEELQKSMGKYCLGLILQNVPGGGAVSAFADSMIAAQEKIEAKTVKDAFSKFKNAVGAVMHAGIDAMIKPGSKFNSAMQDKIIEKAREPFSLYKIPIDKEAEDYILAMQEFIGKEVNLVIFGNKEGKYADIVNKVNDYIQRSWEYFILAWLETNAEYWKCRSKVMKSGTCDTDLFTWKHYEPGCLHEKCKQWRARSPMPPDWKGPTWREQMGEPKFGESGNWYGVSTDVKHPAGVAWVEDRQYEKEKERYKE